MARNRAAPVDGPGCGPVVGISMDSRLLRNASCGYEKLSPSQAYAGRMIRQPKPLT